MDETIATNLTGSFLEKRLDVIDAQTLRFERVAELHPGIIQQLIKGVSIGVHPLGYHFQRHIAQDDRRQGFLREPQSEGWKSVYALPKIGQSTIY